MNKLYLILFCLIPIIGLSQVDTVMTQTSFNGVVTFSGFGVDITQGGQYSGTLTDFSDQTNKYFANNTLVGDVLFDNQGQQWYIVFVGTKTLLTAVVHIKAIGFSPGGAPFGRGAIGRITQAGIFPAPTHNALGISDQLRASIDIHNGLVFNRYIIDSLVNAAQLADSTAAIRADLSPVPADTIRSIVYAPAHGYTLGSFTASIIAVKNNYETANATHLDSIQYLYVVGVPDVDSLEVKGTGEVYRPSHGLTVGSTYYLQNTPNSSYGLSPGTVSSPVFFVLDADNILLLGQGATAKEAIPRKLIPASIITSFGGEPFAPHDTVMQNIAEVFAANGTITPPTILITQSSGSTRNAVHQGATGDPSTPANSWLWDGALVTRIAYATVSISMQDTVWGTLFDLPLDTVELIAGVPTDSTVADWLEVNYTTNGLRLKNGDMMYWGGTKTSPDYIWVVADDLNSLGISGGNWDKIIKRIKEPGGGFTEANTLYVDPNGDNLTALKGRLDKPFSDPWAARDAASRGDLIYIISGDWDVCQTGEGCTLEVADIDLVPDDSTNISYYFSENTVIYDTTNTSGLLFFGESNDTLNVGGRGKFVLKNKNANRFLIFQDNGVFNFECKEIEVDNIVNTVWGVFSTHGDSINGIAKVDKITQYNQGNRITYSSIADIADTIKNVNFNVEVGTILNNLNSETGNVNSLFSIGRVSSPVFYNSHILYSVGNTVNYLSPNFSTSNTWKEENPGILFGVQYSTQFINSTFSFDCTDYKEHHVGVSDYYAAIDTVDSVFPRMGVINYQGVLLNGSSGHIRVGNSDSYVSSVVLTEPSGTIQKVDTSTLVIEGNYKTSNGYSVYIAPQATGSAQASKTSKTVLKGNFESSSTGVMYYDNAFPMQYQNFQFDANIISNSGHSIYNVYKGAGTFTGLLKGSIDGLDSLNLTVHDLHTLEASTTIANAKATVITLLQYDNISGSGSSTFLTLADTPSSFSGQGGKIVYVNAAETALEFRDSTLGADLNKIAPDNASWVIILTGQSNADGRGLNSEATTGELAAQPHVQIWNDGTQNFESLDIGTNNQVDASFATTRHGIELGLAKFLPSYAPDTLYLIKHATGATEIRYWLPGGTGYTELFDDYITPALDTLNARQKTPYVSLVWMQGESDTDTQLEADNYASGLDSLVDIYRTRLSPKLPFYAAEIYEGNAKEQTINNTFASFEDTISNFSTIGVAGFGTDDFLHWNYTGYQQVSESLLRIMKSDGFLGARVRSVDTIPAPSAPSSTTPILNDYGGALVAYSFRELDSTYVGNAINIRRSSDNTNSDIGFLETGILDTVTMNTFCAGTDCFVEIWYDQSGNGYDASQTTDANQPQIVFSGVILRKNGQIAADFDGTNDGLNITMTVDTIKDFSLFSVIEKTSTSDTHMSLGVKTDGFLHAYWSDGNVYTNFGAVGGNIRWASTTTSGQTLYSTFRDVITPTLDTYQDGSGTALTKNLGTTSTSNEQLDGIGKRTTSASYGNGTIQEIILYNSLKTSDKTGIETNINDYYGIF